MIIANMMGTAKRAGDLRSAVMRIAPQVERLNLVLNASHAMPKWMAAFPNLNPIIASDDIVEIENFFPPVGNDDLVFLVNDEISYPADYVARMLEAFDDIAIDRKVVGVGGVIYSDFFDGLAASQLVYPCEAKLAQHQFVNRLDIGTILCRGTELPEFSIMKGSAPFTDLRFAIHCFRNAIPMICVPRNRKWLKRTQKQSEKTMPAEIARAAQEIAGFGRLPVHLLDARGRMPSRTLQDVKIVEPTVAILNSISAVTETDTAKPRMTVVSWSLGSNSAGRAYTLADLARTDFNVELIGTLIPSRGRELWPPLRDAVIPLRGFVAEDMLSYLSGACGLARSSPCEFVLVSKPRLPSLLLGMLLSAKNDCPLLLDVDDLELSFIRKQSPLGLADLKPEFLRDSTQLTDPASQTWARFADTLIDCADAITLSNEALQTRYSGTLVRHARDETQFFPDDARRKAVRHELGLSDNQTVVLFIGTPRPHKGLVRIAAAIAERKDADFILCIIGAADEGAIRNQLGVADNKNIRIFPPQPFTRLPDLIRAGDAVCLLQDPASPISEFQIPAKLSEGLATGLPILASRVAPFSDLIAAGAVKSIDTDEELRQTLNDIRSMGGHAERARRRDLFLSEFSYAANRPRLRHAIETAQARHAAAPHARDAALKQIAGFLASHFGIDLLAAIQTRQTR